MWWDIAAEVREDFEHWHAHEHFPERLAIAGFRRATRWRSAEGGEGMFVLYELADHAVLSSPAYAARLNNPSAWSTRLMPHHRNMVRSQCRVLVSEGIVTARFVDCLHLSPRPEERERLRAEVEQVARSASLQPGLCGLHLLGHEVPGLAATTEQRLRGGVDHAADRILLLTGHDAAAMDAFAVQGVAETSRDRAAGSSRRYEFVVSATPPDVASA